MKIKLVAILLSLLFVSPAVFSQDKTDLLILNKKYSEALSEIEKQITAGPSANLLSKKGLVYKLQQQYQKAAEAFFSASEFDNQNPEILSELAETLNLLDNTEDAARVYNQACQLAPGNLPLKAKLGATYISLKDFKNALTVFEGIYKTDSTNVYWNKQYAFCLAKNRQKDSLSIYIYEKAVGLNPRDVSNYTSLFTLYTRKNAEQKAADVLLRGLAVYPENPDLLIRLANHYLGQKNYKDAVDWYSKYLAVAEAEYEILRNYAICLYFTKNETKAIEVLDQCMLLTANDPIVLFYESLCYKKMADYALAEGYMKSAIESASPSYVPEMYHHLGQIYNQERKFEETIGALQKAYELDTTNFEILFEIATTYEEFGTNKTLAFNYYRTYLIQGGEKAVNINYALTRIERIKEDLFFED